MCMDKRHLQKTRVHYLKIYYSDLLSVGPKAQVILRTKRKLHVIWGIFLFHSCTHFLGAALNGAHEVLSVNVCFIGLVNRTNVHTRDVLSLTLIQFNWGINGQNSTWMRYLKGFPVYIAFLESTFRLGSTHPNGWLCRLQPLDMFTEGKPFCVTNNYWVKEKYAVDGPDWPLPFYVKFSRRGAHPYLYLCWELLEYCTHRYHWGSYYFQDHASNSLQWQLALDTRLPYASVCFVNTYFFVILPVFQDFLLI